MSGKKPDDVDPALRAMFEALEARPAPASLIEAMDRLADGVTPDRAPPAPDALPSPRRIRRRAG
jgi:hypothetical protein